MLRGWKEKTSAEIEKKLNPDLVIQGVRKAEGGIRGIAITSCFSEVHGSADRYYPVFWWQKKDKEAYDTKFQLRHSACYCVYGLDRTGCACCPFGKHFERELEAARIYEPKLYSLANAVFGKSYEYTRKYYRFREKLDARKRRKQRLEKEAKGRRLLLLRSGLKSKKVRSD